MIHNTVVICTKSRSQHLQKCLESIERASVSFPINVIIVFNGVTIEEFEFRKTEITNAYRLNLEILHSEPGLPTARNFSLAWVRSELVTFLDDDVVIPNDFFLRVSDYFTQNHKVDGAAPKVKGLYVDGFHPRPYFFRKNFKLPYGKVTSTCRNYWVPDNEWTYIENAEWLPGCCMIYRNDSIREERFSTVLEKGPAGGYALGEDVDFSIRFKNLGVINDLSIEHNYAPSVRDSTRVMSLAMGRWRGFLIRTYPEKFSLSQTLLLEFSLALSYAFLALTLKRGSCLRFANKCSEINALIWELMKPILK